MKGTPWGQIKKKNKKNSHDSDQNWLEDNPLLSLLFLKVVCHRTLGKTTDVTVNVCNASASIWVVLLRWETLSSGKCEGTVNWDRTHLENLKQIQKEEHLKTGRNKRKEQTTRQWIKLRPNYLRTSNLNAHTAKMMLDLTYPWVSNQNHSVWLATWIFFLNVKSVNMHNNVYMYVTRI